ncbi:putative neutral sphingomyelinase isoform X2 [Nematostella vectensis]|uniref:putative neutral sphingomyelinase isoform X2 n=1 Tax=Nematostella vectensis TaxID=45351 RepID=UPI00207738AB|nr:putative neutral sphingomyelinase isoform X2 [Nematostella vectensis]
MTLSHYKSGVIGSGVCVFSRYPIIESFTYRYTLNGYMYKIAHGDWFGGKSSGYCVIDHPLQPIHFFTTHLHAEYNRKNDEYLAHRVTQAYQLAQFIEHATQPSDCVIVCGDMNSEPTDMCYRILCYLPGLTDTWLEQNKESYHGNTCDVSHNSYTGFTLPQELRKGTADGKRIDYVFYRADRSVMELLDCCVTMGKIPGEDFSYSDHEGVLATFSIKTSVVKSSEKACKTGNDKVIETLSEISSLMNSKLDSPPYHHRSSALIALLLMFIFLPVFLPEGTFLSLSLHTYLGVALYLGRVLCTVLVTALVFYVVLNDRDEYHAYKDVYEAVNLRLLHSKTRKNS